MPANDLTQVIILGASGDLTARKLVPALFAAHCENFFPGRFQLVGVARRPWDDAAFRQTLDQTAPKDKNHSAEQWQQFLGMTSYVQTHLETTADFDLSIQSGLDERKATLINSPPPASTAFLKASLVTLTKLGGGLEVRKLDERLRLALAKYSVK